MGLNMNYRLFLESTPSNIRNTNTYANTKKVITENQLLSSIIEFNASLREVSSKIRCINEYIDIDNDDTPSIDSSNTIEAINYISDYFSKACLSIKDITDKTVSTIDETISDLGSINTSDSIDKKYSENERFSRVRDALSSYGPISINIGLINKKYSESNLLDKNLPDLTMLNAPLINFIRDAIDNYCIDSDTKSLNSELITSNEIQGSESFMNFINDNTETLLSGVFKNPDEYNRTEITKSAMLAAQRYFGISGEKDMTEITDSLYREACSNVNMIPTVIDVLSENKMVIMEAYKNILTEVKNVRTSIINIDQTIGKISADKNGGYSTAINALTSRFSKIINVIQETYNAEFTILCHKLEIIRDIYGSNGDSLAVKKACHELIEDHNGFVGVGTDEVLNGSEITQEFYDIYNRFELVGLMINEFYNERENRINDTIVFYEADDATPDNGQANTTNAGAGTATQQGNNTKGKGSVKSWLKLSFGNIGQTFKRYTARLAEVVTVKSNRQWWNEHKEKIKNNPPSDTPVNEWYDYKFDLIEKSSFIPFDPMSEDLKSADTFRTKILNNISNEQPKFGDNDSFGQKINKMYQGNYIKDDNAQGRRVSETGFNANRAYEYVDDMTTKGMAGKVLSSISNDYKKLDAEFKRVTNSYNQMAEDYKARNNSGVQQQQNTTTTNTDTNQTQEPKAAEPKTASASFMFDGKFNLAEQFSLMNNNILNIDTIHEASFGDVGTNDSKLSDAGDGNSSDDKSKEFDNRVKCYFENSTTAITARMTSALAAYKQVIALYKYVCKPKKNKENK